ncbi:MAG: hypothetical protein FD173_1073 [Gallionellaceae bacterium]|nr:MAG: hypothetical protein FD173_1073 [Gallionellaceae bacterium]
MYYIVETNKPFEQTAADLDAAVKRNGFGVLHVHDIGNTLRGKGVAFEPQVRVFEVCNPLQAAKVMAADLKLNMALPCRISVYTEGGKTFIGMIRPTAVLSSLSQDATLAVVAKEVEAKIAQMMDEAK